MTKKTHSKKNNQEQNVIDFGDRAVSNQNFSKMVALPKTALKNCSTKDVKKVNIKLVQEKGEKFLKLTPVMEVSS